MSSDPLENVIFEAVGSTEGRVLTFETPDALFRFRKMLYAARATIARRVKAAAKRAGEPSPDPLLWGGNLLTIRKSPTTLWVGPKNKANLGVKRIR